QLIRSLSSQGEFLYAPCAKADSISRLSSSGVPNACVRSLKLEETPTTCCLSPSQMTGRIHGETDYGRWSSGTEILYLVLSRRRIVSRRIMNLMPRCWRLFEVVC